MNIKECKDAALKLINIYSIAGLPVALTYNNQKDYILRVPELINDAQMEIAKTTKKIPAEYKITQTAEDNGVVWKTYTLPINFYTRSGTGVVWHNGEKLTVGTDYKWKNDKTLFLRSNLGGEFDVEYFRFPTKVTATTPEVTELDNTLDTHQAVPYFVASMLVQMDNSYLASTLYNLFETRLVRLKDPMLVEATEIQDVYNLYGGGR
jgi:hypothetical protein